MKNILKLIIIINILILLNSNIYANSETAGINWKKEDISKVYYKNTKKLTFLVQFRVNHKPDLDYNFNFKIQTIERKRTCDGKMIYNGNKSLYTICSIKINNIKTLDENINLFFEVENNENYETEIKINEKYSKLKSELIKEKIKFHPGISIKNKKNINLKEKKIENENLKNNNLKGKTYNSKNKVNIYILTKKDKYISNKITKKNSLLIKFKKTNLEKIILKIDKLIKIKKDNLRLKTILQDIKKNLTK